MNGKITKEHFLILSIFILAAGYSCSDNFLLSETNFYLRQIAGCQTHKLNKSVSVDSCFSYTFGLELNFQSCVAGNCCPDSNRYSLSSKIVEDTIEIAVRDTARNLCKCICNYFINARYRDLKRDHYIIRCVQEELSHRKILYLKDVKRGSI